MAELSKNQSKSFLSNINNRNDIFVAMGVVLVIAGFLMPVPGFILDFFMSINILVSLMIILIVLFNKRALDFSVFPTILLVTTVFSLVLNVSSTRLILSEGPRFDGKLVKAFASFVVGASGSEGIIIGLIIFIILIAVQFLVITKGATRVAEVAARFTLDALPGRQMAIDAAYSAGGITQEEATKQKEELQSEVNFYGAMDGASKFISGNVKVGIFITVIDILGGLLVGMTIHGQSFQEALSMYVSLTIGDGLVSQFPALLISTATGLLVTRSISDDTFAGDVSRQFTSQPNIYWISSIVMFLLALIPGFPTLVLIFISALLALGGYLLTQRDIKKEEEEEQEKLLQENKDREGLAKEISPVVPLDPFSLELGYGLIPLVDKEKGTELLDKIVKVRREIALEFGVVVPKVRIIDNMRLEPNVYSFKIRGVEMGKGEIRLGRYMVINPPQGSDALQGEYTQDPAFGLPAIWIDESERIRAEKMGLTVVDPPSIIITHLTEVIKKHVWEVLTRQDVQSMMDVLKKDYPAVVEEVLKGFNLGEIQKVFQGLLKEQVSIRNLVVVLESMADNAPLSKDIPFLIEKVRQSLGRQICLQYVDESMTLPCLTIEPTLEREIIDSRVEQGTQVMAALDPQMVRSFVNSSLNAIYQAQQQGTFPVILCSEAARALVYSTLSRDVSDLVVISVPEVPKDVNVNVVGEISI